MGEGGGEGTGGGGGEGEGEGGGDGEGGGEGGSEMTGGGGGGSQIEHGAPLSVKEVGMKLEGSLETEARMRPTLTS